MERVVVRKGRRADAKKFIGLVLALARFEHLEPPSEAGRKRLVEDVFEKKRINLFVAAEGKRLLGYALYFFTYSSFLARPTLYLEDLFVLEEHRKRGVGLTLFKQCVDEAVAKGCGRMEWSVLTWNDKALRFYEKLGAKRLSEWCTYRLDEMHLNKIRS
jgi:GNAT superfamily N-acetyltransferase